MKQWKGEYDQRMNAGHRDGDYDIDHYPNRERADEDTRIDVSSPITAIVISGEYIVINIVTK
jgi:hypothetical protein